ncbi:MAG TPA: hypothetical protein VGR16_07880, partial [Thermomicrobiales bacterium]|nr:hypothetical protein [Thermomicrobiales bacterium]
MSRPTIKPYGAWESPISAHDVAAGGIRIGQVAMDGHDVYWVEGRPSEGGRNVVVRSTGHGAEDVTPPPFNARTRVHEYGGGAFTVERGTVFFSHDGDGRLYRQETGGPPQPITPEDQRRYADLTADRRRERLICVQEDHRGEGEPENTLVAVPLGGGEPEQLFSGTDFVSSPRLSPDGTCLAWLSWNHPNMPWDGCDLWLAGIAADGRLEEPDHVVGGTDESIFQPAWSPDGLLHFVSDRTGWWNLYRWRNGTVEPLFQREAEFGLPQWVFGKSTYGFVGADRIACTGFEQGAWRLWLLDTASGGAEPIPLPCTEISDIQAHDGVATFTAGSPVQRVDVVRLDVHRRETQVLSGDGGKIAPAAIAKPEAITFPTG